MTIGIYFLEIKDKYYIGQSINIPQRLGRHISMLRSGTHYNKKLQAAYIEAKYVNSGVLEYCTIKELSTLEVCYINEFDSIINGYNITTGGDCPSGRGYTHSASTYTRKQLIEVLDMLQDYKNKIVDIAEITGVNSISISHIVEQNSHIWLAEEFPDKYAYMLSLRHSRAKHSTENRNYSNKIDPFLVENIITKEIREVCCVRKFAKEEKIDSGDLSRLRRGISKRVGSWKLHVKEPISLGI